MANEASPQEIEAMRNLLTAAAQDHARRVREYEKLRDFWNGGPPPPLTRRQKLKRRTSNRVYRARTRLGLLVAPWLDEY